jgi:hypothetical protein
MPNKTVQSLLHYIMFTHRHPTPINLFLEITGERNLKLISFLTPAGNSCRGGFVCRLNKTIQCTDFERRKAATKVGKFQYDTAL